MASYHPHPLPLPHSQPHPHPSSSSTTNTTTCYSSCPYSTTHPPNPLHFPQQQCQQQHFIPICHCPHPQISPPPPPLHSHFHTHHQQQPHQFHHSHPPNPYQFHQSHPPNPHQCHHQSQQQQHQIPICNCHNNNNISPPLHHPHQPTISSLLSRITALESALSASNSLREAAARVIQTHFRGFILHRSRTLGELKKLASIKSCLNGLKASLARNDYNGLYGKATNLLLRLDSIQGGDPMIRDGKMSISRELNQFFKLLDGVSPKRGELSSKTLKNARCGGTYNKPRVVYSDKKGGFFETVKVGRRGDGTVKVREQSRRIDELDILDESECEEYEELNSRLHALLARKKGLSVGRTDGTKLNDGSQAKVNKSVRFADNEKAYRVTRSRNEPVLIGQCDSDGDDDDDDDDNNCNLYDADQYLIIDNDRRESQENGILSQENEDDEEEAQTEDDSSPPSSNGGSDAAFSRIKNEAKRASYDQSEDGSFTFSAPMPVLMEPRADLVSRMKLVR